MDQDIIALSIGSSGKILHISGWILHQRWPSFQTSSQNNRSDTFRNIAIPEKEDPWIFQDLLMDWLHTGRVRKDLRYMALARGYLFAYRNKIPELQRDIVASLYDKFVRSGSRGLLPSYDVIIFAFEHLPHDSKLCEFFVDLYGSLWQPDFDDEAEQARREELPMPFVLRLLEQLGRREITDRIANKRNYFCGAEIDEFPFPHSGQNGQS